VYFLFVVIDSCSDNSVKSTLIINNRRGEV